MSKSIERNKYIYGLILPILLIALILVADILEGPKTAYVGVLACVAPLAAVFGSMRMVGFIAITALVGGWSIGHFASDGNVTAQETRLVIIAIVAILALAITRMRIKTQKRINDMVKALAVAETVHQNAIEDFLTGQLNRKGVVERIEKLDEQTHSVVILDLDNLKVINDEYGHAIGDEYIKAVAKRVASDLKQNDIFGRWGGDEFVAILPNEETQVFDIFGRVLEQATKTDYRVNDISIPIRFSVGVAHWEDGLTFDNALSRADKCLYEAKSNGGCAIKSHSGALKTL